MAPEERQAPPGLPSLLPNSCYLNSALQAAGSLASLNEHLQHASGRIREFRARAGAAGKHGLGKHGVGFGNHASAGGPGTRQQEPQQHQGDASSDSGMYTLLSSSLGLLSGLAGLLLGGGSGSSINEAGDGQGPVGVVTPRAPVACALANLLLCMARATPSPPAETGSSEQQGYMGETVVDQDSDTRNRSSSGGVGGGAAAAAAAVPRGLVRALLQALSLGQGGEGGSGVAAGLLNGQQQDAVEALEALCSAVHSELCAWERSQRRAGVGAGPGQGLLGLIDIKGSSQQQQQEEEAISPRPPQPRQPSIAQPCHALFYHQPQPLPQPQLSHLPLRGLLAHSRVCCACGAEAPTQLSPFWVLPLSLPHRACPTTGVARVAVPAAAAQGTSLPLRPPGLGLAGGPGKSSGGASSSAAPQLDLQACLRAFCTPGLIEGVICTKCSLRATLAAASAPASPPSGPCTASPNCADAAPGGGRCHPQGPEPAAAQAALQRAAALAHLPSSVPLPDLEVEEVLGLMQWMGQKAGEKAAAKPPKDRNSSTQAGAAQPLAAAAPASQAAAVLAAVKARARALQHTRVARLPRALCLQLRRTAWDARSGRPLKVHGHVRFPLVLGPTDLAPLCARGGGVGVGAGTPGNSASAGAGQGGGQVGPAAGAAPAGQEEAAAQRVGYCFALTAVVVHWGGAESGHYLVYRRAAGRPPGADHAGAAATSQEVLAASGMRVNGGAAAAAASAVPQLAGSSKNSPQEEQDVRKVRAIEAWLGQQVVWYRVSDASVTVCEGGAREVVAAEAAALMYERVEWGCRG